MSAAQPATSKIADFDAITIVMNLYTQGVRTGSSAAMKPAFHDAATFFGYYQGQLLAGPIQMLFDWVDGNGPSEGIQTRITSVDMCDARQIPRDCPVASVSGRREAAQADVRAFFEALEKPAAVAGPPSPPESAAPFPPSAGRPTSTL